MTIIVKRWEDMKQDDTALWELLDSYLLALEVAGRSQKTTVWYRDVISRYFKWLAGNSIEPTLVNLSVETVRAYSLERRRAHGKSGQPLSGHTLHGDIRALKAFSSYLEREAITTENRLSRLKLPKLPKRNVEVLEEGEIKQLLACFNSKTMLGSRNEAMVRLMLDCGLRVSEVVGLQISKLNVRQFSLSVVGKGNKERSVGFGRSSAEALVRYVRHHRPRSESDLVFLSRTGEKLSPNAIKCLMVRLARKTGIERLHAHLLRHTFATLFLEDDRADLFTLQMAGGWEDLTMVRRYSHMAGRKVVDKQTRLSVMDRIRSK
jgi:integrase/recombinase XerC